MLSTVLMYLIIPATSGVIGWGTNVLAIKMMFQPIDFVGIPPFLGWQGIIPARASKMAAICVDLMTAKLLDVEQVVQRIEPGRVGAELQPLLEEMTRDILDDVIQTHYPRIWDNVPQRVKEQTYARIEKEIPSVVEKIVHDIHTNVHNLLDVRSMVIDAFVQNRELLNELFMRCGHKEFDFVGRSGLWFGLLFGLVQMTVWIFFKPWWLLPLAGLLVGYATNWLALKMIFEPQEPKKIGPWSWQGLFLKRQDEVAKEYAAVFAGQVLKPENIMASLLRGPASDLLFSIVEKHLSEAVDGVPGRSKTILKWVVGNEKYETMKQAVVNRIVVQLPASISTLYEYTEEALDLETTLRDNLQQLSSSEFEKILRPIFQEDEWILILVGAVLGALAGFAQLVLVFS